jgi:hypothetical protein
MASIQNPLRNGEGDREAVEGGVQRSQFWCVDCLPSVTRFARATSPLTERIFHAR